MIVKAVITYHDGTEVTFQGTPEVVAVPAGALDLSTIPTQSPAEIEASQPQTQTETEAEPNQ